MRRHDLATFAFVLGVIAVAFRGAFQNAELPGWDTPGHYSAFVKMATEYLPHFRLTGYAPEWLGGIALFRFYGPTFFALLAGLWLVTFKMIPLALLFRIGAFAALALVPVALWDAARVWFDRRTARWALLLSLAFVFYPNAYSSVGLGAGAVFWVGYIPSMAGLAVAFFALAQAERLRTNTGKKAIAWMAALVMLLATGHTVSFMVFMGLLAVRAALAHADRAYLKRLGIAVGAGIVASLWWLVPFAAQNALSSTETLAEPISKPLPLLLFPATFPYLWLGAPLLALAVGFGLVLLWRAKKREVPLLFAAAFLVVALRNVFGWIAPNFTFHYYRAIPFAYLLMLLAAAYAFAEASRRWADDVTRRQAYLLLGALSIVGIYAFAFDFRADYRSGDERGRDQIGWRWDEFPLSEEAETLAARLRDLPDAHRVLPLLVQHEAIGEIGSTRRFDSLLALQGRPETLTGVYTESSPLTPFALATAEALTGTKVRFNGDRRLRYVEPFLSQPAATHLDRLRSLGVDHVFAYSPEVTELLAGLEGLREIDGAPPFRLFALNEPEPIIGGAAKPLLALNLNRRVGFRDLAMALYAGESTYRLPVIDGGDSLDALKEIGTENLSAVIVSGGEAEVSRVRVLVGDAMPIIKLPKDFAVLPRSLHVVQTEWPAGWEDVQRQVAEAAGDVAPSEARAVSQDDEKITVEGAGAALLRYGFARGWRVTSGDGRVYQVSPAFMLVTGDGARTLEYR